MHCDNNSCSVKTNKQNAQKCTKMEKYITRLPKKMKSALRTIIPWCDDLIANRMFSIQ